MNTNEICKRVAEFAYGVEYGNLYSIALTDDAAAQKVYDLASGYARIASRLVCGYKLEDERQYLPSLYFELYEAIGAKFERFVNGDSLPRVEAPPRVECAAYAVRVEGEKIEILNTSGKVVAAATLLDDITLICSVGEVVVGLVDVAESSTAIGLLIKSCTIKELLKNEMH